MQLVRQQQDLVRALLSRDMAGRLGCGAGGGSAVMRHPFLAPVDWDALRAGESMLCLQHQRLHISRHDVLISMMLMADLLDSSGIPATEMMKTLMTAAAGTLEPPFVPHLDGMGDRRHFGCCAPSLDGGTIEGLPALLAASGNAFREF